MAINGAGCSVDPDARAVATVDITELALEIDFLAAHYAVADDERQGTSIISSQRLSNAMAKPIRPRNMPR
jgi:hypothetical protein